MIQILALRKYFTLYPTRFFVDNHILMHMHTPMIVVIDTNTPRSDFVSGHWYGCPGGTCSVSDDVSSFKGYVNDLISTADGREVWVPEFQRYGDEAGQREFLEDVLPWLDSSAVVRYAYYMVVDGILTTGGEEKREYPVVD